MIGGLVGTFGIGPLATAAAPTGVGRPVLRRRRGVPAYAFVLSGIIGMAVQRTMGFRIDEEHEVSGIDLVIHAETAYDLQHTTSGARHEPGGLPGHGLETGS